MVALGSVTGRRRIRRLAFAVAGTALWLTASGAASAAESDLYSGLAYLRAGAQVQAEQHLLRYRDGVRDPDIRVRVDRVLPLLKRPLSEDVREYIAGTIEDVVRVRTTPRGSRTQPAYMARMFPVFP